MIFRKWKFEDVFEIHNLEKQCFLEPWTFEMLSDGFLNDKSICFVAEKDNKIIGYIIVFYCLDEAEINRVAVREDMRKNSVGTNLMDIMQNELISKGIKSVFLEVRKSNEKAQNLYKKFGYETISVRPLYYNGKEDAFIMKKSL